MALLEVKNLAKSYGDRTVLDGVSVGRGGMKSAAEPVTGRLR